MSSSEGAAAGRDYLVLRLLTGDERTMFKTLMDLGGEGLQKDLIIRTKMSNAKSRPSCTTHGTENVGTWPAMTAGTCAARTVAVIAATNPAVTDGGTRRRCNKAGSSDRANGNRTVAGSSKEVPVSDEAKG